MHDKTNRLAVCRCLTVAVALFTGCTALKKVAKGGKLTTSDLANEGDQAYKAEQLEKTQIARRERQVDDNPQKIAAQRKATAARCGKIAAGLRESRNKKRWNGVRRGIDDYVQCRRKMNDVRVDAGQISAIDGDVVVEIDAFAEHGLREAKAQRISSKFRYALAYERDIENAMARYAEIAPRSKQPASLLKRMDAIRTQHRDPEEITAEEAGGAYEAWKALAATRFAKEWDATHAAEAKARPDFDRGSAAVARGDFKAGLKALYAAREALFAGAWPNSLAFDTALASGALRTGLSYEIAKVIARVHFDQGDKARLYPELQIIKTGRAWMSKADETTVRLYDILADGSGRLTPKTTDAVRRYAARYAKETEAWRTVKDTARAMSGQAYGLLGVDLKTISHRHAASQPAATAGKVVWVDESVDAVSGGDLRFDLRRSYEVPTRCWNTRKISHVNLWTGRVYYAQKCNYKTVHDGYYLVVARPAGVPVSKGDKVSFYAAVGPKKGDDLHLVDAGFVRVAPSGKTTWYAGAKVAHQAPE